MRSAIAGLLLACAGAAAACGYCVEDKIASVYDHAMVTRALSQKHHGVFFHIEGLVPSSLAAARNLEGMIRAAPGVDAGSTRLALETGTLAVAFDPARTRLVELQAGLEKRLARHKLSLMAFQVMERPGDLKTVQRR